jgi:hypothetical protein
VCPENKEKTVEENKKEGVSFRIAPATCNMHPSLTREETNTKRRKSTRSSKNDKTGKMHATREHSADGADTMQHAQRNWKERQMNPD